MWIQYRTFLLVMLVSGQTHDEYNQLPETTTVAMLARGEKKMSQYILDLLKHFQQPNPVGLPGTTVEDPVPVPDVTKYFGFTTMHFRDSALHGTKEIRVIDVKSDIGSMKVTGHMSIDYLEAKGNCVASTFYNEISSPFIVKFFKVNGVATASLGVTSEGKLFVENINVEMTFESISVDLENGPVGFLISSFVNSAGDFLLDSMKPYILQQAHDKLKEILEKQIEELAGDVEFPNSIYPLDMMIIDARKKLRAMKMDPYKINDYNSTAGPFLVTLTNSLVRGLSLFKRVGNISVSFENNTVIADFEIGMEQLEGSTKWQVSVLNGMILKEGTACFSVEHIHGRIIIAQPVDVRKKSQFRNLNLDIGNIQARSDGAGTIDYIIELAVNVLPNLLRYPLINALEDILTWKILRELNEIDVEEVVKQNLPKFDEFQKQGFKLSEMRAIKEQIVEDDFFNF